MSDEFFVVSASAKDKDAAEISPKVSAAMCTAAFKTLSDGNSGNLSEYTQQFAAAADDAGCNSSPDARTCEIDTLYFFLLLKSPSSYEWH